MASRNGSAAAAHPRQDIDSPDITLADSLYAELDNRAIPAQNRLWTALVTGIHLADGEPWIQVESADDPSSGVVLHMSKHATADHAIIALAAWSDLPVVRRPRVIQVMHAV